MTRKPLFGHARDWGLDDLHPFDDLLPVVIPEPDTPGFRRAIDAVESLVLLVVVGGILPGCAGAFWRRLPVRGPLSVCWEQLGGILAIRWTCSSFGIAPGETITLEKFIAAVAFFGTYPAIPSGAVIGGLCVAAGFVSVFATLSPDHQFCNYAAAHHQGCLRAISTTRCKREDSKSSDRR